MSGPAATTVDDRAVPRPAPGVAAVVLDGEAVLHHAGQVHALDPVATLVWRCCDGQASVGEIADELAGVFGADRGTVRGDVRAAVGALAGLGLLLPDLAVPDPASEPLDGSFVVDPPGSCAACGERTWRHRRSLAIGGRLLAVGTDDPRADAAIAVALAEHLAPTPPALAAEPPFFAVELHERIGGRELQRLDVLLRGESVAARSRHPERVLRALVAHVASYGDLAALGLAPVRGVVAGRDGRAVIVPDPADPVRFRHALARAGVLVADQPVALVDPVTRDVVVGAPGVEVDLGPIDALAVPPDGGVRAEPPPLPWGEYRLVAFGLPAPANPSTAVLAFGPDAGDHRDEAAAVDALVALLDAVPVAEVDSVDAVDALLRPVL